MKYLERDWTALAIANPALRFFHQRWDELLDTSAPVTNRAPVAGALAILRELDELRTSFHSGRSTKANIEAVEQEAFGSENAGSEKQLGTVQSDPVIHRLFGSVGEYRGALSSHFGFRNPPDTVVWRRADALTRVLVHRAAEQYLAALIAELEAEIFDSSTDLKERVIRVDALVTALVAELLSIGYADSFLRVHRRTLDQKLGRERHERARFKQFCERLLAPPRDYEIILRVHASKKLWDRWPTASDISVSHACRLQRPPGLSPGFEEAIRKFERADPSIRFVRQRCSARDDHAASLSAFVDFELAIDLIQAELPELSTQIQDIATATTGEPSTLKVLPAARAQLEFRPLRLSSRDRARTVTGFAEGVRNARSDDTSKRRIAGAIRYYRISAQEQWAESSFTNVWTSLEALAHEDYDAAIIDRVVRSITPIVASQKMRDLTDDLASYLEKVAVVESGAFTAQFSGALNSSGRIDPVLLLGAMADAVQADALAALVAEHPLVQRRVLEYSAIVQTGGSIVERVNRTARRVEWQLRRIYRQRNDIVHGASHANASERLLGHLQLYALNSISTIAGLLAANNGISTIEDAVATIDLSFHRWCLVTRRLGKLAVLGPADWQRCYEPPYKQYE